MNKMIPPLFKMHLYILKSGKIYTKMPVVTSLGLQIMILFLPWSFASFGFSPERSYITYT